MDKDGNVTISHEPNFSSQNTAPPSNSGRRFIASNQNNTGASASAANSMRLSQISPLQDELAYSSSPSGTKRKKRLILCIAAIVTVIAVSIAAGLAININGRMAEDSKLKTSWNEFKSLLYSGSIGDDDVSVSLFMKNIYSVNESDSDAKYSELAKHIDDMSRLNGSGAISDEDLKDIKKQLLLMRDIAKNGIVPSAELIAACYVTSGRDNCAVQIEEHYNRAYDANKEAMQRIMELQLQQVLFEQQLADMYVQHGCIGGDGTVDKKCTSQVDSDNSNISFSEEYIAAKSVASSAVQKYVKAFLKDVRKIDGEINK